jgi:hypothetical protein
LRSWCLSRLWRSRRSMAPAIPTPPSLGLADRTQHRTFWPLSFDEKNRVGTPLQSLRTSKLVRLTFVRMQHTHASGSYQSHAALKGLPPIAYSVTSSNIAACIQSAHQSLPSTSRASLSTSGAYLPNYPLIPAPSLEPRTIHQRSTVRRMNGSGHQASY